MYRGYQLKKDEAYSLFKEIGYGSLENFSDELNSNKQNIQSNLLKYAYDGGKLDAEMIQKDWFPEINADVFISHSHKDEALAKTIANWLWGRFKIKSFIDSCVWGYADDLLKIIDEQYCKSNHMSSYNYTKRNYSTSHVHMLLMTALNKMIDKCECVIFLDTPISNVKDGIQNKTLSPWIYGEIETTRLIEKHRPKRKIINETENLTMKYPLNLGHFYKLKAKHMIEWNTYRNASNHFALDRLYDITR